MFKELLLFAYKQNIIYIHKVDVKFQPIEFITIIILAVLPILLYRLFMNRKNIVFYQQRSNLLYLYAIHTNLTIIINKSEYTIYVKPQRIT